MEIKKYKTEYHKYIFTFNYNPTIVAKVKAIQQDLGWQAICFHKDDKEVGWVFSCAKTVLPALINTFTIELSDEVIEEAYGANKTPKSPIIDGLTSELVVPTKLPLFDFQIKTIDFIKKVGGKALLAIPMGGGKSCISIGYGVYKRHQRVLVICPAFLKEHWKREIMNFAGIDAKILTLEDPSGGWEIIGYSNLDAYSNYLYKQEYDLVICDESSYIKSKKTIRAKRTFNILKKAKDVLFLNGTPVMNRPLELYTTFNFITPINYYEFCQHYCAPKKTQWGWDFNGASNLSDLKEKMWWMYLKKKEDILPDLPEKTVNVIETEMKNWKEYNKIKQEFRDWILENDLNKNALYAEALVKTHYLKRCVVENKNVNEIIDNFLENGKKIVIFSQYKDVVNKILEKYKDIAVGFTGSTNVDERQPIVDKFQKDENVRLFVATIQAGGVGISLTEADTVLFTDLLWTPSIHLQAEDRCNRIGSKNAVGVYYLVTPGTIEADIYKLLNRKEKMINQILEGKEKVRKVHIRSILKKI